MFKHLVLAFIPIALLSCDGSNQVSLQPGEERAAEGEALIAARMTEAIKAVSLQRHPTGEIRRFNQSKSLGCLDAEFTVSENIPDTLRQGLFADPAVYPARIRFANASEADDTRKDFRGLSIKLFNVPGTPLWGQPGEQDFLLNSYPVLFAADPADFLDFIEAIRDDSIWRYFIQPSHFYSLRVVFKGRQAIDNPFSIRYWSTTPYRYGDDESQAVKYSVQPCAEPVKNPNLDRSENFLTLAMAAQLRAAPACFDFMIQFQGNPQEMPIENASIVWDEQGSPFRTVARITIPDQEFLSKQHMAACEAMRFNPWQSLAAHQPLGGINRVRKAVYAEIADFRHTNNKRRESN